MRCAVLLIVMLACRTAPTVRSAPPPPGDNCIVTAEEATKFYSHFIDGRSMQFFTPSSADVDTLQAKLSEFLSTKKNAANIVPKLAGYRGVFIGIVVDGRRVVRGFYSCEKQACSERSLEVMDGGECFFDVDFDLASGTYINLYVHGVA